MTKKIERRDVLKLGAGAGAAALAFPTPLRCLGTTKPSSAPRPVLVTIYLRGGQDALNTVVPYAEKRYYEIRPTIAIPAKSAEGAPGVLKLDKQWGLHPAMRALMPLWEKKMFAPVVNVGSPHPTRSHFDAQDFMEYAAPGMRPKNGGWLNRYLQATDADVGQKTALRALAMQGLLPRSLRGPHPVLAVPERQARRAGQFLDLFDELYTRQDLGMGEEMEGAKKKKKRRKKNELEMHKDDPVVESGRHTIETLRRYQEIVGSGRWKQRGGRGVRYPRGRLGNRLADIAKVVKAGEGLEVACVDWNGWDHHTGEGGVEGRIARMLEHLCSSIAAFMQDLGDYAQHTVVMTMTEFGRTCRENGNMGTDHGHGGAMLLAGGPIRGGQVYGRFDGLDDKDMYQGRDLPCTTDFRQVMGELLLGHMRMKEFPKDFFPNYKLSKKSLGICG